MKDKSIPLGELLISENPIYRDIEMVAITTAPDHCTECCRLPCICDQIYQDEQRRFNSGYL